MKGDFSRDSFDPNRKFYRLLMQQGRVQVDADWNEQIAILLHRLETIVGDVFGSFGGPRDRCGFEIRAADGGDEAAFVVGAGRYYVDGVLVENERKRPFQHRGAPLKAGCSIVYLDVWEEFVAPQQDPSSLDPALGGLDTTARTQVRWRVRLSPAQKLPSHETIDDWWPTFLKEAVRTPVGPRVAMAATVATLDDDADPAVGAVRVGYHGSENRLYRVEIHNPGSLGDGATFKWSRDNGSVAFAIHSIAERVVTVEAFGRDERADLKSGDWVEIVDDDDAGALEPARDLFEVAHADTIARTVTLKTVPAYAVHPAKHPVLRRWDQRSKPLEIPKGTTDDNAWIALENGISIRFAEPPGVGAFLSTGEYWTIPARTVDGGVLLWEKVDNDPVLRESSGIRHHYAPLAGIELEDGKIEGQPVDYRRIVAPLGTTVLAETTSPPDEETKQREWYQGR